MGWCHEFGPQIRPGCDHPMTAGGTECHCLVCGTRCEGRFKGCSVVWARGPTSVHLAASRTPARPPNERPPGAEPSPVPEAGAIEAAVPAPPPRTEPDVFHGVSTALETVSAELRAMRAAIDNGRGGSTPTDAVLARVAELLDRLPGQMRTVVRDTMAESSGNGRKGEERRRPFGISFRSAPPS